MSRPLQPLSLVPAAALALGLALAQPALAGTVTAAEHSDPKEDSQFFTYSALPGETNRLAIAVRGRRVIVSDPAGVRAGRGCKRGRPARATRAVCVFKGEIDATDVAVRLGDGDDGVRPIPAALGGASVSGGPGRDSIAGSPRGDAISGGPGADRISARCGRRPPRGE